jgi:hypothetical protein
MKTKIEWDRCPCSTEVSLYAVNSLLLLVSCHLVIHLNISILGIRVKTLLCRFSCPKHPTKLHFRAYLYKSP